MAGRSERAHRVLDPLRINQTLAGHAVNWQRSSWLVFVSNCPHEQAARALLRRALDDISVESQSFEW